MSVNRAKYDKIKNKANKWADYANDLKNKVNHLTQENSDIITENEELLEKIEELESQIMDNDKIVDNDQIEYLEDENRDLKKTIRTLNKKLSDVDHGNQRQLFELQKDLILKEGRIQQLQDSLAALNERYKDIYEEYRDHRRYERSRKE